MKTWFKIPLFYAWFIPALVGINGCSTTGNTEQTAAQIVVIGAPFVTVAVQTVLTKNPSYAPAVSGIVTDLQSLLQGQPVTPASISQIALSAGSKRGLPPAESQLIASALSSGVETYLSLEGQTQVLANDPLGQQVIKTLLQAIQAGAAPLAPAPALPVPAGPTA